jgi:hypothetical protein
VAHHSDTAISSKELINLSGGISSKTPCWLDNEASLNKNLKDWFGEKGKG